MLRPPHPPNLPGPPSSRTPKGPAPFGRLSPGRLRVERTVRLPVATVRHAVKARRARSSRATTGATTGVITSAMTGRHARFSRATTGVTTGAMTVRRARSRLAMIGVTTGVITSAMTGRRVRFSRATTGRITARRAVSTLVATVLPWVEAVRPAAISARAIKAVRNASPDRALRAAPRRTSPANSRAGLEPASYLENS